MDRTMVILDIFASRARTREGKIQVELAQLRYRAVRLVGLRNSLSRLGGGIGTRGPGEKKLEVDRRLIHERISQLKSELESHAVKPSDPGWDPGRGQAVRHSGPHHPGPDPARRRAGPFNGYGRFYPEAPPPSDRSL